MTIEYLLQYCNIAGLVKVHDGVYKAWCPVCGESHKRSKKRFYVLLKKEFVYCHH